MHAVGVSPKPVLLSPADHSSISGSLNITFSLPWDALPGSLSLNITTTSGDSTSVRTVVFAACVESAGVHTIVLSTLSATNSAIVSVTPSKDLLTGATYFFSIGFTDYRADSPSRSDVNSATVAAAGECVLTVCVSVCLCVCLFLLSSRSRDFDSLCRLP